MGDAVPLMLLGSLGLFIALPVNARADAAQVETTAGPIVGTANSTTITYLGIPYAEPPVGELRWRPPQPRRPWHSLLEAKAFGNHCLQANFISNETGADEDCLYLNVYVPRGRGGKTARERGPRPVLVWIHGGANADGASNFYDPTSLVETGEGVVVVTVNYRIGPFGFLAHPALDSEGHPAVNYGILDQQLALKWVRANIGRFGGDARNVTLVGQSSGGVNVMMHLASPFSAGLFERAIIQSGAYQLDTPSLSASEALGIGFAARIGCQGQTGACMRAVPAAQILANGGEAFTQAPAYHQSTVDGNILKESLRVAFAAGRLSRVPVLQGSNRDESRLMMSSTLTDEEYRAGLKSLLAARIESLSKALDLYSRDHYPNLLEAFSAAGTDSHFACPAQAANALLSKWVSTYAYEFSDSGASAKGAAHGAELRYLFNVSTNIEFVSDEYRKLAAEFASPLSQASLELARAMRLSWVNFAASGNPRSEWIAEWPVASKGVQILHPSSSTFESNTNFSVRHHCDFWNPQ